MPDASFGATTSAITKHQFERLRDGDRLFYLSEDILEDVFPVKDGHVVVPDGPGLGISVNPDIVEKYAVEISDQSGSQA